MENKKLDETCVTPNYKEMCAKAQSEAEYWRNQHRKLMGETIYLRGVKHAIEAMAEFLTNETARMAKPVFDFFGYGIHPQVIYAKRLEWLKSEVVEDEL